MIDNTTPVTRKAFLKQGLTTVLSHLAQGLPGFDLIQMGTAVIELTVCTAFQGSGCRVCYDVCPIQDDAIQLTEGLPQIMPDHCTGCGVCVYECPTPEAIRVVS